MDPQILNLKVLIQLPMFADVNGGDLDALAPYFQRMRWEASAILFKEGEACHELVFLITGRVSIQRRNMAGNLTEIAQLGPHDALGESGFLDNSIRTNRAIALEPVDGLVMSQQVLDQLTLANPSLANQLLKVLNHSLAQKLRKINAEFIEFKR